MISEKLIPKNHLLVRIESIIDFLFEYNLVMSRRYIDDTIDVAADVNYPSGKKLIGNALEKVIKEIGKFKESLARQQQERFEAAYIRNM